jgi:hypothetical protein
VLNEIVLDRVCSDCVCFLSDFKAVIEDYGITNIDSLLSLISEVNLLKISPTLAIKDMNINADDYAAKIWQVYVKDYPIAVAHSLSADVNFSWRDTQFLQGSQANEVTQYMKKFTNAGYSSFTVDLEQCKRDVLTKTSYLFTNEKGFEFTLEKIKRKYIF